MQQFGHQHHYEQRTRDERRRKSRFCEPHRGVGLGDRKYEPVCFAVWIDRRVHPG